MRILHVLDHGLPLHSGYTFRTRAILKAQMARGWEERRDAARRFVEEHRNWSSNIARYIPVYQKLTGKILR